jgi:hypothetical protein
VGQRFYGEPETEVHAAVDAGTIRAWNEESGAARVWGASRAPHTVAVTLRERVLTDAIRRGSLRDPAQLAEVTPELAEFARGRIFGAFEYRFVVAPGARETLRIAVVFDGRGSNEALASFDALLHDPSALEDTERY